MITSSRMCIAYANILRAPNVVAVTLANCTAVSGHPASNLGVPDPHLALKTTTPTANPQIMFELDVLRQNNCLGIVNHNVRTGGYTGIRIETASSGAGPWTTVDSDAAISGMLGDSDILLRFPDAQTKFWRLTFQKASAWAALSVGMVFIGTYEELTVNPLDGTWTHASESLVQTYRAAGGALYTSPAPPFAQTRIEGTFLRIPQYQLQAMRWAWAGNGTEIVAAVPPDEAAIVAPAGFQHFFGRVTVSTPQPVAATAADGIRYNLSIVGEGAV